MGNWGFYLFTQSLNPQLPNYHWLVKIPAIAYLASAVFVRANVPFSQIALGLVFSTMNTLLFAYANDRARPLPSLSDEDSGIDQLLDARASRNHFQKIRDSFATTESVAAKLLTYQDSLCLFHFSGHAGGASLHLEDTEARGQGIAQLLGRCPNLRLVFLNGCSTLNHIQLLKAQGVRAAVLATSTPIEDALAARFALQFYRAMVNQYPVAQALDAARLELQVSAATDIQPIRGDLLDDGSLAELSRNQWYFYAPDEEATRWELPTGVDAVLQEYKPNSALRKAFFNALRAYDASLTEQFKAKQTLPPEALKNWLNEEVMRRLPYPISEPLRKLFCPTLSPDGKLLPVGCTRERLVNYVSLFESSVDLLVVALLAQVFDRLIRARKEGAVLTPGPEETAQVQALLTEGWSELSPPSLVRALKHLSRFLTDSQTALFVSEMQELVGQFDEKTAFYESMVFFDDLRRRLADPAGVGNIPSLCQVGEDHLVELADRIGFWANYQLESYKNIRVVSFFHRAPAYKHERVVLRTSQSYRLDETYFQEVDLGELWESQSVLLVKTQRAGTPTATAPAGFLNLSPLLIDRNVYLKSDNAVFDLYTFHSDPPESGLHFRHIARPEDLPLVIAQHEGELLHQQDFSVLHEQIRVLRSLLSLPEESLTGHADDDLDQQLLSLPD